MRINQNIMAFNAYRNLQGSEANLGHSLEKLSSGYRINRAADDAAGLVISYDLRAQASGLKVATRNAQDGISVVQTAEGSLNEVNNMLQRMRDLAVQAANGSNSTAARSATQAEFSALAAEISRIASSTKFGAMNLLDGSVFSAGVSFQIGANAGDTVSITISAVTNMTALSAVFLASVMSQTAAADAISAVGIAIASIATVRGGLGAVQNRFESTINSLQVSTENVTASESRIRDTDMASEMADFTKNQILIQAGTSMLSQSMQVPQSVLKLLQ